ncbi:D-inositol 3-phosphate glycosyltransferase protein [Marine Group I thaumarchaeote SCGC AAA799-P11]|uniref:D-inositol 3-phosphate glycosyltransferase protein n=1 Tax=Marine Group I thaumarchaeote SCGC AAA799-P11 TaxID=1502295 RepID=A0A087RZ91_9ARCH|nr:D-inositol 3-phosphate glycosyltransferase protein [Marine Group I thaumarchaeote SCGC AAA799-P11]
MKILHTGNMANLGYFITKQLRERSLNVELLMEKSPKKLSDPLTFDTSLNGKYPNWIHFFDKSKFLWFIRILKQMRSKDIELIHAYVEFPIFALFSNKPYVAYAQGSDLRELAFSNSVKGILLRLAYKKAKLVITAQPDHIPFIKNLKIPNWIFLPVPWNDEIIMENQTCQKNKQKFTIFHPSDLNWSLKGNDIFIKGFAKFVKKFPNSILIIIERGKDSSNTKKLIHELKIEDHIQFIKGPLLKDELFSYYGSCDVVVDQFIVGSLGTIALEAMLHEKPVITFIHKTLYQNAYSEMPPVQIASNSDEILCRLESLINEKNRLSVGKKSREWVQTFHSSNLIIKNLIMIYDSILKKKSIDEIKSKIDL